MSLYPRYDPTTTKLACWIGVRQCAAARFQVLLMLEVRFSIGSRQVSPELINPE